MSVSETASEQYEATTNGNDFTSLLSAGDKVIVVDRDDVDKKSYKMTISSITADKITFVEFLNAIDESKQFMLQKVNEFELEVVNGVTQTKEPVSFATANADVTVCYIRKPVANNAWYALANGFHVVSVDTLGVTNVMEPAKHIMAVKDQPVTIQFRGVGLRYADRAYFVEAGAPWRQRRVGGGVGLLCGVRTSSPSECSRSLLPQDTSCATCTEARSPHRRPRCSARWRRLRCRCTRCWRRSL